MQGLLFLVDATNRADLSNSRSMLNYFRRNYQVPILVCANKQDLPGAQPLAALNAALQLPEAIPLLPLCSLQKGSVSRVIKEILQRINQD
jgi:signal recognition particle receptor subunit beta